MEYIVANVDHIEFKIERDLNEQFGALALPFPGMDSMYKVRQQIKILILNKTLN